MRATNLQGALILAVGAIYTNSILSTCRYLPGGFINGNCNQERGIFVIYSLQRSRWVLKDNKRISRNVCLRVISNPKKP